MQVKRVLLPGISGVIQSAEAECAEQQEAQANRARGSNCSCSSNATSSILRMPGVDGGLLLMSRTRMETIGDGKRHRVILISSS